MLQQSSLGVQYDVERYGQKKEKQLASQLKLRVLRGTTKEELSCFGGLFFVLFSGLGFFWKVDSF